MGYTIKFSKLTSHIKVVESVYGLITSIKSGKADPKRIHLDFRDCSFIKPDYLLMVITGLEFLRKTYIINGKCHLGNNNLTNFLSRIDFFKQLGADYPQSNGRNSSIGKFIEIKKFKDDNEQLDVVNSIMRIIKDNCLITESVYTSLDYCLQEITDNVLNHSQENNGWVVAQYYPILNQIRIMIADYGIGIHKSLITNYPEFSDHESIIKCIEQGIKGKGIIRTGQGHGLYATSMFAELNQGNLSIISGEKLLEITSKNKIVLDIPFWQGTCIFLLINTNIQVDYHKFTSNHYDYGEIVKERLKGFNFN